MLVSQKASYDFFYLIAEENQLLFPFSIFHFHSPAFFMFCFVLGYTAYSLEERKVKETIPGV